MELLLLLTLIALLGLILSIAYFSHLFFRAHRSNKNLNSNATFTALRNETFTPLQDETFIALQINKI